MKRVAIAAGIATVITAVPAQALAAIRIHKIYFDSPGPDTLSNASLNAEYIVIKNTGSSRAGVGSWTIRDIAGHVYRFPAGFRIRAGAKVVRPHGQRLRRGSAPVLGHGLVRVEQRRRYGEASAG
jgi:hypothetical protein